MKKELESMSKFKNVNDVIWKAEIKNDSITGMLVGIKPFVPPKGMKKRGDVNQYTILDINDVQYSMIGGTVLDKLVGEESEKTLGRVIAPGDVVRFIFQGMRISKNNDEYKSWAVQMIPSEELSDNWKNDVA